MLKIKLLQILTNYKKEGSSSTIARSRWNDFQAIVDNPEVTNSDENLATTVLTKIAERNKNTREHNSTLIKSIVNLLNQNGYFCFFHSPSTIIPSKIDSSIFYWSRIPTIKAKDCKSFICKLVLTKFQILLDKNKRTAEEDLTLVELALFLNQDSFATFDEEINKEEKKFYANFLAQPDALAIDSLTSIHHDYYTLRKSFENLQLILKKEFSTLEKFYGPLFESITAELNIIESIKLILFQYALRHFTRIAPDSLVSPAKAQGEKGAFRFKKICDNLKDYYSNKQKSLLVYEILKNLYLNKPSLKSKLTQALTLLFYQHGYRFYPTGNSFVMIEIPEKKTNTDLKNPSWYDELLKIVSHYEQEKLKEDPNFFSDEGLHRSARLTEALIESSKNINIANFLERLKIEYRVHPDSKLIGALLSELWKLNFFVTTFSGSLEIFQINNAARQKPLTNDIFISVLSFVTKLKLKIAATPHYEPEKHKTLNISTHLLFELNNFP